MLKRVSCNTDVFRNQLTDVFSQLNETEIQLNGLEAWGGLPPDCFTTVSSTASYGQTDPDLVSMEAHTLVEMVNRLQVSLRSMVSKNQPVAQGDTLTQDNTRYLSPKPMNNTSQQRLTSNPMNRSDVRMQSVPMMANSSAPIMNPQSSYSTVSPQVFDPSITMSSDETASMTHASRPMYKSPSSTPAGVPIRSPATERRLPIDMGDPYASTFATNRQTGTGYSPLNVSTYGSTPVDNYPPGAIHSHPPDFPTQPMSGRLPNVTYHETGTPTGATRNDYFGQSSQ